MTYVHGLGDAQERMTYEDNTPRAPMCKCCGTKTEYEEKRQTGCVDVYVFFCPRGACESYGQEQIIAIDLDELYGY